MKKGMFVVLFAFAVLFVSACGSTQVQTESKTDNAIYFATVDYSQSLDQMIVAGNYAWIDNYITAGHFPVTGNDKVEVIFQIIQFNRNGGSVTTKEVLAGMEYLNLRPATLPELLAFGAKYPDIQQQFPVFALGSTWTDPLRGNRVAIIDAGDYGDNVDEDNVGRRLRLDHFGDMWMDYCRFLAVAK